jgi:tetratricopeptide (TPR) repeat protein
MLLNQELKGRAAASYRYFSLVNLLAQRFDDALEYISFAMEQAEKTESHDEMMISACFAAGIQVLYGNLSRAERFTLKAEEAAEKLGHIEWAERARFLRGKIRFETGYYAEALEIFHSLAGKSGGNAASSSLKPETIASWTARAAFFLNKGGGSGFPSGALRERPCPDGLLFEIEAACLAGNYREAENLAEKWRASAFASGSVNSIDDDFLFTEQPDWRSGFAQCEFMLIPARIFRSRFVSVYQALARSRLETSREGKEELVNSIRQLLREDLLANTDPNEVFYLYACYRILKETGAAQVDLNTAVSMAFKRLQRRAGRIDDDDARQTFLARHHWNGALSLAAREYKLI